MHAFSLAAAGMALAAALAGAASPAMGDNIIGTPGNDVIRGTAGDDRIQGRAGHDSIDGRAGDDYIVGLTGADFLHGSSGNDVLRGGPGPEDFLNGWAGNDHLYFGRGPDYGQGGAGNDQLRGGPGIGLSLQGEGGNDRIWGGPRRDLLYGGAGDDWLFPGPDVDVTEAEGGRDRVLLRADGAPDQVTCGLGVDLVEYTGPADPADTLRGCEQVRTHVTPRCVTAREWDRAVVGTPKKVVHRIFETPGKLAIQRSPTEFGRAYRQCRPDPGYDECWADVDYRVGSDDVARVDEKAWSSLCAGA